MTKVLIDGIEYVPKSEKLVILTNVSGLKLNSFSFEEAAASVGASSLYDLLRIPNLSGKSDDECCKSSKIWQLKELHGGAKLLFIFDEFQRKFDTKYNDPEVLFFFQYHRHLGIDIYFMTQSWFSVNKKITDLCEYEYRALPRSFTVFNEFRYGVYCAFDKVGSIIIPMDKKIFRLYKSTQDDELKGKEIRPVRKFAFISIAIVVATLAGAYWFLNGGFALAGASAPTAAASPPASPPKTSLPGKPVATSKASDRQAVQPEQYVLQFAGGFFVGDAVKAIQWNGRLVPVDQFPYQWSYAGKGQIQVFVPASAASYALPSS